jgi:hypothetical protein
MFVIGGCELPLEKNPYNSIEVLSIDGDNLRVEKFSNDFPIPVRSPMSFIDELRQKLYIIGGCRGYRDHIDDV